MFRTSIWKFARALLATARVRATPSPLAARFARWVARHVRGAPGGGRSAASVSERPGSANLIRPPATPEAPAATSGAGGRAVPHAVASALAEAVDAAVGRRASASAPPSHWHAADPIKRAAHAARTLGIPVETLIIEIKAQLRNRHPEHGTARRVREPLVTLLIGAYYRS